MNQNGIVKSESTMRCDYMDVENFSQTLWRSSAVYSLWSMSEPYRIYEGKMAKNGYPNSEGRKIWSSSRREIDANSGTNKARKKI